MKLIKFIFDLCMKQITELGSLTFSMIVLFIFFFIAPKKITIGLFFGLLFCMVIGYLMKLLYFKERPRKMDQDGTQLSKIDASSFPSIHSARIFTLTIWCSFLANNFFLITFFYIILGLVLCSRIYLKKHNEIEVFVGVLLAAIINLGVYYYLFGWWF